MTTRVRKLLAVQRTLTLVGLTNNHRARRAMVDATSHY